MTDNDVIFVITKQNIWKITTVVLLILVVAFYLKGTGEIATKPSAPTPSAPSPQPEEFADVSVDDDPFIGDENAKIIVIEFSDFQCPFCKRAAETSVKDLRTQYVDTGKIKFVFVDYPLGFHPEAQKAAEASECAHEQGKFWEYHDKIFENQQSLSVANEKQWAKDLGLDSAKFDNCLDSGKYAEEVKKDAADGAKAGVSGTPTFFINGRKIVGAVPFQQLQTVIEQELAK